MPLDLDWRAEELRAPPIVRKLVPQWAYWVLFVGMIAAMLIVVLFVS